MKPVVLIAVAAVAVISVAAIAFAATSGGGDDDDGAQAQTPTATATRAATATATPSPPTETPTPSGDDTPATSEPLPTPVANTPVPTEPSFTVTPAPTQPSLPAGRHAEPAPIDELDLRVAESFPPQYFVYILAGLPSGCAEQYTHNVTREGNVIQIEVLNSLPDGAPICTAIYGTYELNIALGSDFVSGEAYKVIVNDGAAEYEFVAQ